MKYEKVIENLGFSIPVLNTPPPSVSRAIRTGNLVYLGGHGPSKDGKILWQGKVGTDLTLEQGYEAAKYSALNCIGTLKAYLDNLDNIKRIVRVIGYISSAPGFNDQHKVLNGASDLLYSIFGDTGSHTRLALGVAELALNLPIEVEMIVEVN